MATKKSIVGILGLVLILVAWEITGTMVEHRDVLREEGEDVVQPAAVGQRAAHPTHVKDTAVSAGPTASSASGDTHSLH